MLLGVPKKSKGIEKLLETTLFFLNTKWRISVILAWGFFFLFFNEHLLRTRTIF